MSKLMSKLEELRAELSTLQAEIARIKSEGRVLTDCWIAKAKPGGSKKKKYHRLKSRKPMFDGKKTEYLSIHSSAVAEAEAIPPKWYYRYRERYYHR